MRRTESTSSHTSGFTWSPSGPKAPDRPGWPSLLILLAAGTICAVLCFLTPRLIDDWIFTAAWRQYSPDGGETFSWGAWADYITEIRQNDNVRLSNVLAPIFAMFSPWHQLFPWLTGAIFAYILFMVYRFCGGGDRPWIWLALIWAVMIVILPWRDSMFVSDYALNYIWSAGITMLTLCLSLRLLKPGKVHAGRLAVTLILAVLAGWWHEGFGLPVSCGMLAWAILNRFRVNVLWIAVALTWLAATLAAFICPGMMARFDSQVGVSGPESTFSFIAGMAPCILTLLASVAAMFSKTCRQRMNSPVFVVFVVALLAGVTIGLCVRHYPRQSFWPLICAIVCLGIILRPWLSRLVSSTAGEILAVVLAVGCTIQGISACLWGKRLLDQYNYIMDRFNSGETTVFHDITMPEDLPEYTLRMPSLRAMWLEPFNMDCIDEYFRNGAHAVVPESLRGVTPENSRRIPGTAEAYATADAIWTQHTVSPRPTAWQVTLDDGTTGIMRGATFRFSPNGADSLHYIKIFNTAPSRIRGLNLLEQ